MGGGRRITSYNVCYTKLLRIASAADLDAIDPGLLPGILKRARFGYDGKGQARVATGDDVRSAFHAMGAEPCVLEGLVDLACEVSAVVAVITSYSIHYTKLYDPTSTWWKTILVNRTGG